MLFLPSSFPVYLRRPNSWVLPWLSALFGFPVGAAYQKGSFCAPCSLVSCPSAGRSAPRWRFFSSNLSWEEGDRTALMLTGPWLYTVHASLISQLSGATSKPPLGARLSSEEELKCPSVPGSEQLAPLPHLWASYSKELRSFLLGARRSGL